jgi:hypothetical protein
MVSQQARIRRKGALLSLWAALSIALCGIVVLFDATPSLEAVALDRVAQEIVGNTTMGRQAIVGSIWWAPLPTILRVPLAAWWPTELAPGRVSQWTECTLWALACLLLAGGLARYQGVRNGVLIAALTMLNPWILLPVMAGSSLALTLAATLTLFYAVALWANNQGTRALITAGLAGAILLGSSALGLPSLLLVAVVLIATAGPSTETHRKEAVFLLGLVPTLYVLSLWALLNWLVMGSPLYFLGSLGGFGEAMRAQAEQATAAGGSLPLKSALRAAGPLAWAGLLVASIAWARNAARHHRTAAVLALLAALQIGCGFVLQLCTVPVELITQHLYATALPCAVMAWSMPARPSATVAPTSARQRLKRLLPLGLASLLLIAAVAATLLAPVPAGAPPPEETPVVDAVLNYVDARSHHPLVFVAGYTGLALTAHTDSPRLINSLDFNFNKARNDYYGKDLFLLVHRPTELARLDSIHWLYRDIYELGSRTTLYATDIGPWRLFEIIQAPLDPARRAAAAATN